MEEKIIKACKSLAEARQAHPGLEQIGEVMHHVDAVVAAYNEFAESDAEATPNETAEAEAHE